MPVEVSHLVFHYIRRQAINYIPHQDKLTNMSIIVKSVTSKEIYLKFDIKQKNITQKNLKCSAFLQEKRFNRTQVEK
jgi:hypothetical protein